LGPKTIKGVTIEGVLKMIKFWPVLRSREELGELDEIVAQLFNDLGSGDTVQRTVSRAAERNGSLSRRGNSRGAAPSAPAWENRKANLARAKSSEQDRSEDPSVASFDWDVSGEGLFFDEERHPDKPADLSFEDKELVERTVAELATRPHAYRLLELIFDGLSTPKQKADIPLDDTSAIDGGQKPARPPGAVNPRPASDETET
jgi:hypothetical protein